MLPSTAQIFKSALAADPSVSVGERNRLLKLLRDGPPETPAPTAPEARIYTRGVIARKFNRSLRYVDLIAAQGLIRRRILPGRKRACGFLAEEVDRLIEGKAS